MSIRIRVLLAALPLLQASGAFAEVIISTDKPAYEVGEIVRITAQNLGPEDEELVSFPYFVIGNQDSGQCIYGCLGLPVVDPFPAGATIQRDWDTGERPDEPGTYVVQVATLEGPSTTYVLNAAVPQQKDSWTALKARYR